MNWRRGVCILAVVICLATPSCAAAQQFEIPMPPTARIARVLSDARQHTNTIKGEGFTIYYREGAHPDDRIVESFTALMALVESEGKFEDIYDRPVEVYVLTFDEYLHYSYELRKIFLAQKPEWRMQDDVHLTDANFLPVPEYGRNVILTYSWSWTTMLHELCHVAIMRSWDVDAAVDHNIVYGAQRLIMDSDEFYRFLDRATANR